VDRPNKVVYSSNPYRREDLENFTIDSYEMQFPRALWGEDKRVRVTTYDNVDFEDDYDNEIRKIKKEAIKFREKIDVQIQKKYGEKFEIKDFYSRLLNVVHQQEIKINDSYFRELVKLKSENFSLFDEDERQANSVIYDIEFDNTPLNEADFSDYYTKTTPLNYSTLQPLIPGEYEYQNAIVGVQMRIPPTQGRFGIIGSKLHVDVEDTVEKGNVVLTSAGPTTVRLNKKFYTVPHVLTSLVDSEGVGIIEVSEVGKDYFVIGLKSLTNPNEYVNGSVDWLVDGY
jgi:hypothetical protein